jgi:hypothetical protein
MTDNQLISKSEAIDLGLKNYFTGIPCKHGHTSERSVACGKCVECNNGHSRAQYRSNPDERKQAARKAYIDTNGAAQKRYRLKNKKPPLSIDHEITIRQLQDAETLRSEPTGIIFKKPCKMVGVARFKRINHQKI